MTKRRKTKSKPKVIYRTLKPKEPSVNISKVKDELKDLETRKQQIGTETKKAQEGKKGFSKFLTGLGGISRQAGINKSINERKRIIRGRSQVEYLKQQTEVEKAKRELAEVRGKRVDFNRKNAISYDDLFK